MQMTSSSPRVLHVTPFLDLSGANRAMLTLVAEQARHGPAYVFCLLEGEVAEESRKLGITVRTAYGAEGLPAGKVRKWWHIVRALAAAVREFNVDLMHSHSAIGNHYCWPAKIMTGRRLVTHQRDNYFKDYFHFGLGAADHIITVSNWIK